LDDARWTQCTPSEFAWERAALTWLHTILPSLDPFRAWANGEFVAGDGSVNEVDVVLITPAGVSLVEIKSWRGHLSGDGTTWQQHHRAPVDNPVRLVNKKARKFKSLLQATTAMRGLRAPWVEGIVFLSVPELDVGGLTATGRANVFGRPNHAGLPDLLEHLRRGGPVDAAAGRRLARAVEQAGIRQSPRARKVGTLQLRMPALQEGPGWQDYWARHERFLDDPPRRVRIYLVGSATTADQRSKLVRAAEREYKALRGIEFPGISAPIDFVEHDLGPALVFPYDEGFVRLDHFLTEHGTRMSVDERLALVRSIAETMDYAHRRVLTHRSLGPSCIWVRRDGEECAVRVTDWQTASRGSDTGTGVTGTRTIADLADAGASGYCAPEWAWATRSGVALDVFSLGATAYFVLTGQAPAASYAALTQRLHMQGALHLRQQLDGVPEALDQLIADATAADPAKRTADVSAFLAALDEIRVTLKTPVEEALSPADPLQAEPGDEIDGFTVVRVLGRGSTARALLVHTTSPDDISVLKVSLDPSKDGRLRGEADALAVLRDQPGIVRLEDGPLTIGNRLAILLSYAGERTLAQELRERGRLQPEWLHDWGRDLLDVVDALERLGVAHRDIKPDNLGVHERGGKATKRRLALFDFSLAAEPLTAVDAGTPPYLDPFLGGLERRLWDVAAERYAAAVTLYEMATGRRPEYGGSGAHPGFTDADVTLDEELFERAYAGGLAEFFRRALDRDTGKRFETTADMRRAWDEVFRRAETVVPPAAPLRLTRDTPLGAAVLSPQVLTALERLGVTTVGAAADLPLAKVVWLPGIGTRTRTLLVQELGKLRDQLPAVEPAVEPTLLDQVAAALLPGDNSRAVAEALLGLGGTPTDTWPSSRDVGHQLRSEQRQVRDAVARLEQHWVNVAGMSAVRDLLVEVVDGLGGVAPAGLCAAALLDRLGSAVDAPLRERLAAAVVRAAIDAELADPDLAGDPRLTYSRQDRGILVAAGPATAGTGPGTADRLEWATRLGAVAAELAGSDPLPVPQRVLEALRAVSPSSPEDASAAPDDQLVAVAVLTAANAAATPRLEIYPRGLDAGRALRLAAGSLYGATDLAPAEVAARVAARFTHALPLPGRPELDALLAAAGVPLVWNEKAARYVAKQAPVSGVTGLVSTTRRAPRATTGTGTRPGWRRVEDAVLAADDRLLGTLEQGGWLVVTVAPRRLARAERQLAGFDGVAHLDVERVVLDGMRSFCRERNVRWERVLLADAGEQGGPEWARLRQVVAAGVDAFRTALQQAGTAVLVVNSGVLARYDEHLSVLATVKGAMRTGAGGVPRTVWLLVPWGDPEAAPLLDGVAVPMLGTEWLALPPEWIAKHEDARGGAA